MKNNNCLILKYEKHDFHHKRLKLLTINNIQDKFEEINFILNLKINNLKTPFKN